MASVLKALETQLMRIAQLQAQLDRLAMGEAPIERRKIPRTEY
jgi:hypothetical protein